MFAPFGGGTLFPSFSTPFGQWIFWSTLSGLSLVLMINDDIKPAVMMMYGKHEELVGIVKVLTSQIGYKMRWFYEVLTSEQYILL